MANHAVLDSTSDLKTPLEVTCLSVLSKAVGDEPGVVNVQLNPRQETIAFDYDPDRLSDPEIVRLARQMQPAMLDRFIACQVRATEACATCALALEHQLQQHARVRRATASYANGLLSVTYAGDVPMQRLDVVMTPAEELEAAAAPTGWRRLRSWLTAARLEAIFTATTLVAMLMGGGLERAGAPPLAINLAFAIAYVAGGAFGLKGGLAALRQRTLDVDLLIVLAASGAWLVGAPFEGAMLLFLFSLSNVLQAFALDRTRNAIRALMQLRPAQALVRRGGRNVLLPIEKLVLNDRVIVRPGERVPVDGVVSEGESTVDQSSITGESMPVSKRPDSTVLAGTINQGGGLEVRVTRLAQDSTIARMIKMVEDAQSEKARTQRFIDKFEQVYAWVVIGFTVLLIVLPPWLLGEDFATAFYRAMTVMVAASPCALVISTPASILSAIGNGARRGVLFKGGVHVEQAATIKVIAFDKTGTLTEGKPQVTSIAALPAPSIGWSDDPDELLRLAAAVEAKSEHPLAQAVVKAAHTRQLHWPEARRFQASVGRGVRASVADRELHIGGPRFFEQYSSIKWNGGRAEIDRLQAAGVTPVIVAQVDGDRAEILGVLGIADVVRPGARAAVQALKRVGVERVVMLTGDNERVAQGIGAQAGVDEVYADLLPEDKLRIVKELKTKYGSVAMVGDGVNDAPALAAATLGIAMGAAGTDVALETADVVLLSNDLQRIPYAIGLSRQTRKTLAMNLVFALFMIGLMLVSIFAASLPLPLAVFGHEGGTVLVSLNGLRLLAYRG